ncbi:DUF4105 domain-containing protein [Luteimonas sp. RD2P54]|uniref:DUF4105 domain-containing protein n=1 Tax=Luteimonas endophytica TaxID=3042023 RepID=A0ABT6JA70_9GAMM|nr:DUF4105 domain-containing protein [Luteimonas endophytica]MDH5823720.1 DUF4105 domain-containing protein [Luteimonas endophytica]
MQWEVAGAAGPRQAAARALLQLSLQRLPARWRESLPAEGVLEWRDDLPPGVHGRAGGRRIQLDRALLDDWMARPPGAGVDDPATRAALAAAIHELAHLHDRSPAGGLSRDPRLLDLAGWQVRPFRAGLRTRNAFTDRSPDRYELESPAEFVAVNLEHFLLDPGYGCRRPGLYRHFAAHFDHAPPVADCAPGLPLLVADAGADSPLLQIDPARVHAVDYLLAEPDGRPMSRWGHSMLRLVVCAPGRAPGPDCRLDLQHHLVLSFRAFVDDVQISSWRGLTGSYPSRLYVLPLAQVIDEYTGVELRGLQSIPLALGRDEVAMLLERAARLHWSYDGRYYFLGNNCAVETFKLLHDGVPRLAGARLASVTPTALLRRLERAGIADSAVLDDRERAQRLGHYFASASARYQAMFEVARQSLGLPQARVEQWLELAAARRRPWLGRADLRAAAALLLLEQAALRREESRARDALKRHLSSDPARRDQIAGMLHWQGIFSRPAQLLGDGGYGLPQRDERAALARSGAERASAWQAEREHLHAAARGWLPPARRAELDATEANLALLSARLRELHQAEGGLRLDGAIPARGPTDAAAGAGPAGP